MGVRGRSSRKRRDDPERVVECLCDDKYGIFVLQRYEIRIQKEVDGSIKKRGKVSHLKDLPITLRFTGPRGESKRI